MMTLKDAAKLSPPAAALRAAAVVAASAAFAVATQAADGGLAGGRGVGAALKGAGSAGGHPSDFLVAARTSIACPAARSALGPFVNTIILYQIEKQSIL